MDRKRKNQIILPVLLITVLMLCLFSGCGVKSDEAVKTFSDLSGKTVSMLTGAPFEELIRSKAPDVGTFTFYNNNPDMLLALEAGKTDAVLSNNAIGALAVSRNPSLTLLPESLQDSTFGFAFAKGDPARDRWQEAYDRITEEEIQALWEKWTGADEQAKTIPAQDWPGLNGSVRAAVCDTLEPMSYAGEGGELKGFDIEMILTMAKDLDVHVEFTGMEFSAVLSSVQAGKADLGAGSVIVTEERKEGVDFLEYYPASFVLIVRKEQAGNGTQQAITSFSDLEEKRIGVSTGSIQALQTEERFPNAELHYFNNDVDMLAAMRADKIDAYASAEAIAKYMMAENPDLTCLDEYLASGMQVGAVFPKSDKGQKLCDEFNSFIREIRENGVYDEIQDTWFGEDASKRVLPDLGELPAENGTLRMAADVSMVPFVFIKDGQTVGTDVDTVIRFCREYGYGLEIVPMDFAAIIPSIVAGKTDFACSGVAYTPERAESVLYSEFIYEGGSVIAVLRSSETSGEGGFLASVKESFEKTFIRESRWKLFLGGIATTLIITALSILFGTVLGFFVFMLCRNGNRAANAITRFFVWLIRGMPIVVLLMILYYIIFGNVSISGTVVSVIGFTLVFGAGVYGMITSGVGAIDTGQLEAAYALGYSDRRAFFRVILPQAFPHFIPVYKGSITELIKATAIVGYVAVQDLTKIGDIIRSRTYEAFFPLIAVAVIYFVLAAILTAIVERIGRRIDPRSRKREDILKGVRTE